jgi:hypothetical protein
MRKLTILDVFAKEVTAENVPQRHDDPLELGSRPIFDKCQVHRFKRLLGDNEISLE